jgi:hypothetical protein
MKFDEHPLNREISEFQAYMFDKVDEGHLTPARKQQIMFKAMEPFDNSGLERGPDVSDLSLAIFRQVLHLMKKLMIEECPQLADEIRNFGSSKER